MTGERCECGLEHDIDPVPEPDDVARMWAALDDAELEASVNL